MYKIIDPEGIIIGVYETRDVIPNKLANRAYSYYYPKEECIIVEVTDPKDIKRLLPSLEAYKKELNND